MHHADAAGALADGRGDALARAGAHVARGEHPGHARLQEEWAPIARAESLAVEGTTLCMQCVAREHRVELRLVFPRTGGIRVFGAAQGDWRPAELLPLRVAESGDPLVAESTDCRVVIRRDPFSLAFHDGARNAVTQIAAGALALRFGPGLKVLAVDIRSQLRSDEVIYGFGERYDSFNHNGNVLTLWGTDDWIGNGVGLRNTTYKPLPIFHSSRGYSVFVNSSYRLRADVGRTDTSTCRLTLHGPILDFYLWIGTPEKALQSYTALTGRPPLPPRWAFEPWMGRGGEAWANGPLANATLTIIIPAPQSSSKTRRPAYVSSATKSLKMLLNTSSTLSPAQVPCRVGRHRPIQ